LEWIKYLNVQVCSLVSNYDCVPDCLYWLGSAFHSIRRGIGPAKQLGLKLEPQKAPVDMIIIDHIEKPTES